MKNFLLAFGMCFFFSVSAYSQASGIQQVSIKNQELENTIQIVFEKRVETIELLNLVREQESLSQKDKKKLEVYSISLQRLNYLDYTKSNSKKRALKSLAHINKSLNKMID